MQEGLGILWGRLNTEYGGNLVFFLQLLPPLGFLDEIRAPNTQEGMSTPVTPLQTTITTTASDSIVVPLPLRVPPPGIQQGFTEVTKGGTGPWHRIDTKKVYTNVFIWDEDDGKVKFNPALDILRQIVQI